MTEQHAMLEQLTQYGLSKQFSYAKLIYQSIYLERSTVGSLNDVITSNTVLSVFLFQQSNTKHRFLYYDRRSKRYITSVNHIFCFRIS